MRLLAWLRRLTAPDVLRDLHVYGGLLLAGVGGWLLSPAWTLVLVGLVLVGLGLLASTRSVAP